jgi:hypothetical protein
MYIYIYIYYIYTYIYTYESTYIYMYVQLSTHSHIISLFLSLSIYNMYIYICITHMYMGHYMVRSHLGCGPQNFGVLNLFLRSGSSRVCSRISPASASTIISCQRHSFGTTKLWWAAFKIHMGGSSNGGSPSHHGFSSHHGFQYSNCLIWMIWGYQHFGKPPYTWRGWNH